MWYRVTLSKDGAIRECVEVSASKENGEDVFYFEADSRAAAIELARKGWKARYRSRVYQERRRLGVCSSCNAPALSGKSMCQRHLDAQREANRKVYEKKKELGIAAADRIPPEHDGRKDQQARMIAERQYGTQPSGLLNLRTLLICQSSWRTMSAPAFGEWIQARIDEYRNTQTKRGNAA